jgi:hypothetical protein
MKKVSSIAEIKKIKTSFLYIFPKNEKSKIMKNLLKKNFFFYVDNFAKISNSSKTIRPKNIKDKKENTLIIIGLNNINNIPLSKLKNIKIFIFESEKIKKKIINLDDLIIKDSNLNNLFLNFNCDKGSHYFELNYKYKSHNYSQFYEKTLKHLKNYKFNMLELGVYKGASTASFNKYFKRSQITAIDINKKNFEYSSKRIAFLKANYLDKLFIKKFTKKNKSFFDVVIDDGELSKSHILKNLKNFIWTVKSGGYYVIEDLGFQENFTYKNDLKKELSVIKILKRFQEKKIFKSKFFSLQAQVDIMKKIDEIKIYKGKMKKNGSLVSIIAFIKIKDNEILIKSKNLIIKPMTIKNINHKFINSINSKNINKFTQISNKKQTYKSCLDYFLKRLKNNEFYYSINSSNNEFYGTLTLREISSYKAYFGILIFDKKFQGTHEVKAATNIFLDFCFKKKNPKIIMGVTYKKNKQANFNLTINNFSLTNKFNNMWHFAVTKKNFINYHDYKISELS